MNLMFNESLGEGRNGAEEVITTLLLCDSRHRGIFVSSFSQPTSGDREGKLRGNVIARATVSKPKPRRAEVPGLACSLPSERLNSPSCPFAHLTCLHGKYFLLVTHNSGVLYKRL